MPKARVARLTHSTEMIIKRRPPLALNGPRDPRSSRPLIAVPSALLRGLRAHQPNRANPLALLLAGVTSAHHRARPIRSLRLAYLCPSLRCTVSGVGLIKLITPITPANTTDDRCICTYIGLTLHCVRTYIICPVHTACVELCIC